MSGPGAPTLWQVDSVDNFADRCAALGVWLWALDASGAPLRSLIASQSDVAFQKAILHPSMRSCLERHTHAPVECMPGLFVMALRDGAAPPRHVTALWTKAFVESQAMDRMCHHLSLDVRSTKATMLRSACESPVEIERLSRMIEWLYHDRCAMQQDRQMLDRFSESLVQAYEEINMLFRIARMLNGVSDPCQLMQLVCGQLQQTLPFGWVAAHFNNGPHVVGQLADRCVVGGTLPFPHEVLESQARQLMSRWQHDDWSRLLTPDQHELARLAKSEIVADPIAHDDQIIGVLLAGNKGGDDADMSSPETQFVDAMAEFLGVFHENLSRFAEQRALFMGTLRALTASIDAKDSYTRGHSDRVALLAGQMAQAMGMDSSMVEQYRIAGLVHDLGKIGVPETVLAKRSQLSAAEFALVRRHPHIGHQILKDIPLLEPVLPGVLHHHERYDGEGYPDGLMGENIPLIARVLSLADAFDAMSSTRAYRPARTRQEAIAEMCRCAGTQFDPNLTPVFLSLDFRGFDNLLAHQRCEAQAA